MTLLLKCLWHNFESTNEPMNGWYTMLAYTLVSGPPNISKKQFCGLEGNYECYSYHIFLDACFWAAQNVHEFHCIQFMLNITMH